MNTALFIMASTLVLYFILRPLVKWYEKAKNEMEEAADDRTEQP